MKSTLASQPVRDLIRAIASEDPAPGAGAAAGLALALAAACGAKAAALSNRHRDVPDGAAERLRELATRALSLAEEDAVRFEASLRLRDAASSDALEACGRRTLALAADIEAQLVQLRGSVTEQLAGDLAAAAALIDAGRRIQGRNLAETVGEATEPDSDADAAGAADADADGDFAALVRSAGPSTSEIATELDLDPHMLDEWCAGHEAPPAAVLLAIRQLAASRTAAAAAVRDRN